MSTSRYGGETAGLVPPDPPGGMGKGQWSFGEVVGASGPQIGWGLLGFYFLAAMAADLSMNLWWLLRGSTFGGSWALLVAGNAVQALATLLAYRWIRNAALAALAGAGIYSVLMFPIRLVILGVIVSAGSSTGSISPTALDWFAPVSGFVWVFLFLLGVGLLTPVVRSLWLGLALGALAGQVGASVLQLPLARLRYGPSLVLTLRGELENVVFDVVGAGVFALLVWAGVKATGARPAGVRDAPTWPRTERAAALQAGMNFLLVRRSLRAAGIGSMIFGVIAIALGAYSMEENPINVVLLLLGVFLLAEGIWIVAAPSAAGIVVDALALVLVGLWNLTVTFANASAGGGRPGFGALGALQIFWAIQSFRRYGRFSNLPMKKPDTVTAGWLDQTTKDLDTAAGGRLDRADFVAVDGRKRVNWKGRLLEDMAVFVRSDWEEALVAEKWEVSIMPMAPGAGSPALAQMHIGMRIFEVTEPVETVDRVQRWKAAP